VDLKQTLENVDKLGYEPELLELLSVVTLMRELEKELREKLQKNDVDSLEYEAIINNYQTGIYRRILSKLDIEKYYDEDNGMSAAFYNFEDRTITLQELIDELKDSIRYTNFPAIKIGLG